MKRLYSTLVIALTLAMGCSKDKNEPQPAPAPTPPSTSVGVTSANVVGTWQVDEVQLSRSLTKEEIDCGKKTTLSFSENVLKISDYQYSNNECLLTEVFYKITIEDGKIYYFNEKNEKELIFVGNILDNKLIITNGKDGADKIILKKLNDNKPSLPAEKQATAEVSTTGASLSNISFEVLEKNADTYFLIEKKDFSGGSVSFDVKKFIGKELTFRAIDKNTNDIVGETSKTITEGNTTISIAVTKKVYTATITVTKNNVPQSNVKVFALDPMAISGFLLVTKIGATGLETHLAAVAKAQATTNTQGVVTFENLKSQYKSLTKYSFVVLKNKAPYYQLIELDMNGTAQTGKIALVDTPPPPAHQPIKLIVRVYDTDGNPLTNAKVQIGGASGKTDEEGKISFNGETNATYQYTITNECGTTKSGSVTTHAHDSDYTHIVNSFEPEKGNIVITNNSEGNNPYTVSVGSKSWIVEGGRTLTLTGKVGVTYNVRWKQNSGYIVYPTTGNKKVSISCKDRNVAVTFS